MHDRTEFLSSLRSLKWHATQTMKAHVQDGKSPGHIIVHYKDKTWWRKLIRKPDGTFTWYRWERFR